MLWNVSHPRQIEFNNLQGIISTFYFVVYILNPKTTDKIKRYKNKCRYFYPVECIYKICALGLWNGDKTRRISASYAVEAWCQCFPLI
jgi:hypothetical protein